MQLRRSTVRLIGLVVAVLVAVLTGPVLGLFGLVLGFLVAGVLALALRRPNTAGGSVIMALLALIVAISRQVRALGVAAIAIDVGVIVLGGLLVYLVAIRLPKALVNGQRRRLADQRGWRYREADEPLRAAAAPVLPWTRPTRLSWLYGVVDGTVAGTQFTMVSAALLNLANRQTVWVTRLAVELPQLKVQVGYTDYEKNRGLVPLSGEVGVWTADPVLARRLVTPEVVRAVTRADVGTLRVDGSTLSVAFVGHPDPTGVDRQSTVVMQLAGQLAQAAAQP
jgi:hypothetical protein